MAKLKAYFLRLEDTTHMQSKDCNSGATALASNLVMVTMLLNICSTN